MEETTFKKSFMFISCEEAYAICDKSQYGEATFWELFKLKLRYAWCRIVKSYVKRNLKLTAAIQTAKVQSLHPNERRELIEKFNQQLKNEM